MIDAPTVYNVLNNAPGGTLSGWAIDTVNLPLVLDSTASTHYAVAWAPGVITLGNNPNVNYGGTYTFSVRCRATVPVPPGATLTVQVNASNGNYSFVVPLATITSEYTIVSFSPSQVLTRAPGTGFYITITAGGFAGLLFDFLRVDQITPLAQSAQVTSPYTPQTLATTPAIWHGRGLYAEYQGIEAAAFGIAGSVVTAAPWYTSGLNRGFTAAALTTAASLAAYRLLVIDNLDLRTFTANQQAWIAGYVQSGGSLLLTGGVYALGRGRWDESDILAPVLPVVLTPYDLIEDAQVIECGLSDPPVTLWHHRLIAKPGAGITASLGNGSPAIVTGTYGAGRVAVIGLTPLGVVGSYSVWWNDPRWPTSVILPLLNWLLA